jgi:integrase
MGFLNPRSEVRILSAHPLSRSSNGYGLGKAVTTHIRTRSAARSNIVCPEHRFKKRLARAGLPPIRIHDLRHTAGSLMLAQGVPAPEVSRILGHASVNIAYRLYAHAVPQAQ